jgi:hypothetical protein
LKTIAITSFIRCRLPEEWVKIPGGRGITLNTPDGGTVNASAREFQKPARPGMGSGMSSEQMLSAQVAEFGQTPRLIAPGRAYASHPIPIGEPGREVECRVWHLVNQAARWHHETVMFSYEPGPSGKLDSAVVSLLDAEVPRCEFSRSLGDATAAPEASKPWWKFW